MVYLSRAAAAFRSPAWMQVELTGAEAVVGEPESARWFTANPDDIKAQPVLTAEEWMGLVERVAGPPPALEANRTLEYAAQRLRHGFAAEVWEAAKAAGEKHDIIWFSLVLRLLSEILGQATRAADSSVAAREDVAHVRREIQQLAVEIRSATSEGAAARASLSGDERVLLTAIDDHYREIASTLGALVPAVQGVKATLDEIGPVIQKTFELVSVREAVRQIAASLSRHSGNLRRPNPAFVGRTGELGKLEAALLAGRVGVVTVLHGLGGVGRTELAVAFAHRHAASFPAGLWLLEAEGHKALLPLVGELALDLGLPHSAAPEETGDQRGRRVLAELARRGGADCPGDAVRKASCLILLDNVSEPELLAEPQRAALPSGHWLRVIATEATSAFAGQTVLVIGHRATFYALEHLLRHIPLREAMTSPWHWQPGWTYPGVRSDQS